MKIKVLKRFNDLTEKVLRAPGEVFEADKARFEEIDKKIPGYVEALEEAAEAQVNEEDPAQKSEGSENPDDNEGNKSEDDPAQTLENQSESDPKPTMKNKREEITAYMDAHNIEYGEKDTKEALIAKIG